MTRRVFALLPGLLFADDARDAWDVIAALAAALADENAPAFLKRIDPGMAGYSDLKTNVTALVQAADVRSAISPIANEGDGPARVLRVDWELHLKPKGNDLQSITREEAVSIRMQQVKRKWLITQLEPVALFAPPRF